MADKTNLVLHPTVVTTVEEQQGIPELGQWYWVADDEHGDEDFACVVEVGSNYAEFKFVEGNSTTRIHLDEMATRCRFEPNGPVVIERNVSAQKGRVRSLMNDIEALTARLGVGVTAASLGSGEEGSSALAKLDPNHDVSQYKTDLVKAKEKDLPWLLKQIEDANDRLATWLKAETLPMTAQLSRLKGVTKRIDDRIFTIELYAGLTETVELIVDGAPAAMTEKVRLMQRRCYMDEECLAQYQAGGMDFSDLPAFDAWLTKPENLERLLPSPRCIVSFRVRRNMKERDVPSSFIQFFRQIDQMEADKLTFLYIRNGERVYRMNTALEFGAELFPDIDHHNLMAGTRLWGKQFAGRIDKIITDNQFQGLVEEFETEEAEYAQNRKEHASKLLAWRMAKKAAEAAGEGFDKPKPWLSNFWGHDPRKEHEPFEPNNIYYDDMQRKIGAEIQQSNRIAIIIQGLLDRSMTLHPHPPWKIWSEGGSEQALEFVYDSSRTLVAGGRPDFEAYRQKCNETLKVGSLTVGQRRAWKEEEDPETGERKKRSYDDPGPGVLARVTELQRKKGRGGYAWLRGGRGDNPKQLRVKFACDLDLVLNVDAYKVGDFKQFFADPRTRADYLEWAPFLLEAEEYHAGNRKVEEPPPPGEKKSSHAGRLAYARRTKRLALMNKVVRLKNEISTKGGDSYKAGTLWLVVGHDSRGLVIRQCDEQGKALPAGGHVRCIGPEELVLA